MFNLKHLGTNLPGLGTFGTRLDGSHVFLIAIPDFGRLDASVACTARISENSDSEGEYKEPGGFVASCHFERAREAEHAVKRH